MDWITIREDYPELNAAQIQQMLGEYQLGGKPRPRGWFPPPEEVEPALRSCMLSTSNLPLYINQLTDFLVRNAHLSLTSYDFQH